MEKIKLHIKNIKSKSDSKQLEELIGKKDGVSVVKISHETGKAVLVVDKNKTDMKNIYKTILSTGNYTIDENKVIENSNNQNKFIDKDFLLGLLTAISIFSIVINIILLSITLPL